MHIVDWGSSMYGGYYVNYIDDNDKLHSKHFDRFRDMTGFVSGLGMNLPRSIRIDN